MAIQNARLYKEAQEAARHLQAMSQRLVEVQESERRDIARELHDQIGQIITGFKLQLEMSTRLSDSELRDNLSRAQTLVQELLERVRQLSLDLRPTMLDDLGLVPALLWFFGRFTDQTNVPVACMHSGIDQQRFPPKVETAVYRIVQEALTNIARHASARSVTVRLWATSEAVNVQIQDDGVGFDPQVALAVGASTGLSSMRERAMLLGGHLDVESSVGAGARVTAELPLQDPLQAG
jgi:signal transduction histidine kinase